jgi:hypothetical protein
VRIVKLPVCRSPKIGKQKASEAEGEFGEGSELLQDLRELIPEVIADLTEYPEVQRND